jgi:hypothetical protein
VFVCLTLIPLDLSQFSTYKVATHRIYFKIRQREFINQLTDERTDKMKIEETRNGILKTLENKGGNAPMKIVHGYSKLIHKVAHKEFSDVMEGLVNDELVIFDDDAFILTEKGSKLAGDL